MEVTNVEIQTIWLQPLLCTDKCLKKIAIVSSVQLMAIYQKFL